MKSAEAVAKEWLDRLKHDPSHDRAASLTGLLRGARAEVWEEAAKFVKKRLDRPEYTWLVEELRSRARLSEPPRGPGQGEER